mgnify:CR=1 FL=1
MRTDVDYLRGLVGARLANKDNWVFVIAGSKEFVKFISDHPLPMVNGGLIIRPHAVVAGDIAGHPELWVMIGAEPKETDPVEAKRKWRAMKKTLRLLGQKGPITPEQDILVLIEPTAPRWALRLLENYLEFIRTGEGAMEPLS